MMVGNDEENSLEDAEKSQEKYAVKVEYAKDKGQTTKERGTTFGKDVHTAKT